MLAGITTDQYLRVREQTPPDFIQSKIWVNCTSGSVQWPYKRQHLLPLFGHLSERLSHPNLDPKYDKKCKIIAEAV